MTGGINHHYTTTMRHCRRSNPSYPLGRREYSPLYYNDILILGPRVDVAIPFPSRSGYRARATRVTGGKTHHYTTTSSGHWVQRRMCRFRGLNPGHSCDRLEYSPLYYNDLPVLGPRADVAIRFPSRSARTESPGD